MSRLGLLSLKPLVSQSTLRAIPRQSTLRFFSTNPKPESNVLRQIQNRFSSWSTGTQFKRSFRTSVDVPARPQGIQWGRLAMTAGAVAASVVVCDAVLNGESTMSQFEKEYLHSTFKYTGGGLILTAVAARAMFTSGFAYKIMASNPWLVLGVSLVGSIGMMAGTYYTDPSNPVLKHAFWIGFNAFQAATLSPMFFFSPAILSRAALYTCGLVGTLSYVGATAQNDKFLNMGGPLLAGLTVVALASLAPMVLPMGIRSLAFTESISLYGGLAVFSGLVLYDTQKIMHNGRLAAAGRIHPDPLKESISLELDMINIFVRMVSILSGGNHKK